MLVGLGPHPAPCGGAVFPRPLSQSGPCPARSLTLSAPGSSSQPCRGPRSRGPSPTGSPTSPLGPPLPSPDGTRAPGLLPPEAFAPALQVSPRPLPGPFRSLPRCPASVVPPDAAQHGIRSHPTCVLCPPEHLWSPDLSSGGRVRVPGQGWAHQSRLSLLQRRVLGGPVQVPSALTHKHTWSKGWGAGCLPGCAVGSMNLQSSITLYKLRGCTHTHHTTHTTHHTQHTQHITHTTPHT